MSSTFQIRGGVLGSLPALSARELGLTNDQFRLYAGSAGGNRIMGLLNKIDGTTAPGVNDDASAGYSVGSQWVDTTNAKVYVCSDSTTGAAVWKQTGGTGSGSGGTVTSITAGAGLSGGTITTTGTIALDTTYGNTWTTQPQQFASNVLSLQDLAGTHQVTVQVNENETANRQLSLKVNDASRTIDLSGNLTVPSAATVSGTNTGDQTLPTASSFNLRGAYASLPAAGTAGRTYQFSDVGSIYHPAYDTGSAWQLRVGGCEVRDPQGDSWTQDDAVTSTFSTTKGGYIISAAAQASVNKLGAQYTAAPTAPYNNGVRIGMSLEYLTELYAYAGCGWSDGTKYVMWMIGLGDGTATYFRRMQFTDKSTNSSNAAIGTSGQRPSGSPALVYFRLIDDNTNLKVAVSFDGAQYFQIDSVARTAFLSTPSKIAIAINPFSQASSAWFFDKTSL